VKRYCCSTFGLCQNQESLTLFRSMISLYCIQMPVGWWPNESPLFLWYLFLCPHPSPWLSNDLKAMVRIFSEYWDSTLSADSGTKLIMDQIRILIFICCHTYDILRRWAWVILMASFFITCQNKCIQRYPLPVFAFFPVSIFMSHFSLRLGHDLIRFPRKSESVQVWLYVLLRGRENLS